MNETPQDALYRLYDQTFNTAGDTEGRQRASRDYMTVRSVLREASDVGEDAAAFSAFQKIESGVWDRHLFSLWKAIQSRRSVMKEEIRGESGDLG